MTCSSTPPHVNCSVWDQTRNLLITVQLLYHVSHSQPQTCLPHMFMYAVKLEMHHAVGSSSSFIFTLTIALNTVCYYTNLTSLRLGKGLGQRDSAGSLDYTRSDSSLPPFCHFNTDSQLTNFIQLQ